VVYAVPRSPDALQYVKRDRRAVEVSLFSAAELAENSLSAKLTSSARSLVNNKVTD
jgi:hypothetical protein